MGLFVGLTTLDVVHVVDELPRRNEKVTAEEQFVAAGGPAANAAVTFAALGGRATLYSVLGSHPVAAIAAGELTERGVAVRDAVPERAEPPAVSAVRVEAASGERSVTSTDAGGAQPPARGGFGEVDVLLLDGHWPDLALPAAAWARSAGVAVVLDAGRRRPVFTQLFGAADLVVASSDFRPDPSAEALLAGADAVAVTAGDAPITWRTADGSGDVPVPRVAARDTAGAGDAFHGAIAYAVAVLGWPTALAVLAEVLGFAAEVAAVRVRHLGPRAWLADPALPTLARRWN